tara:strand:- start:1394 stop:1804 length:411 start_codon:yes stop_codon:yes gene_type:complete
MSKKLLFEDLTQHQNQWVPSNQMQRRAGTETLTILDILTREREGNEKNAQHPNNAKAQGPEIYGTSPLVQMLGDLMIQNEEIKKAIRKASSSPVLDGNTKAKAELNSMMAKLQAVDNLIRKVGEDIDQFRVKVVDV